MIKVGSLVGTLSLDNKKFMLGMDKSVKATRPLGKEFTKLDKKGLGKVTKSVLNLKTAIIGLAGAYGLKKLAGSFVHAASTAEGYRVRLKVLLGTTKEGNRLFDAMAGYAAKVAFRYEDVMGAATNLSGVMKGGTDEIKRYMPMIGDLAAATGLSIQDTTSQVIRMYSAGAAAADMFRERGVLSMMGFKAGVSYTAEETRKMMFASWEKMGSQFRGAAQGLSKTWTGLLSMLSDAWFQFRNIVMDAGIYDELKNALDFINVSFRKWIGANKEIIKQKIQGYVKNVKTAVIKLYGAIKILSENINKLLFVLKTFVAYKLGGLFLGIAGSVGKATKAIMRFSVSLAVLKSSIIGLGVKAKGGLIGLLLFGVYESFDWAFKKFDIVKLMSFSLIGQFRKAFEDIKYYGKMAWLHYLKAYYGYIDQMKLRWKGFVDFMLSITPDAVKKALDISDIITVPITGRFVHEVETRMADLTAVLKAAYGKINEETVAAMTEVGRTMATISQRLKAHVTGPGRIIDPKAYKAVKELKELLKLQNAFGYELGLINHELEIFRLQSVAAWKAYQEGANESMATYIANAKRMATIEYGKPLMPEGAAPFDWEKLLPPAVIEKVKIPITVRIKEIFGTALGAVKKTFTSIVSGFKELLKSPKGFIDLLKKGWKAFTESIPDIFKKIFSGKVARIIGKTFSGIFSGFKVLLGFPEMFVNALQGWVTFAKKLPEMLEKTIPALIEKIPDMIDAIVTYIPLIIEKLIDYLPILIDAIASKLPELITKFVGELIPAFIRKIPDIITSFVSHVPEMIKAFISSLPAVIGAIIDSIPDIIMAFVKAVPDIAKALIEAIWKQIPILGGEGAGILSSVPIVGPILDKVFGLFHQGGKVGQSLVPKRSVPVSAFANAPELAGGFAPDEFPAILHRNERVLTEGQNKEYERGAGGVTKNYFVNQGVITTDDVDTWFAERQEKNKQYRVGGQYVEENLAVAGLDM